MNTLSSLAERLQVSLWTQVQVGGRCDATAFNQNHLTSQFPGKRVKVSALYRIHWVHKSRLLSAPTLFDLRACSQGARGQSAPLSCAAAEDSKPGPDPLRGCCRARRRTMCCQRPGHSNKTHICTRAHMHCAPFTYMHKPPPPSLLPGVAYLCPCGSCLCMCLFVCVFVCVHACVRVSKCVWASQRGRKTLLASVPSPPPTPPPGLASKKKRKKERAFPSLLPSFRLGSISRCSPYITAGRVLIWPERRDGGESVGSFLLKLPSLYPSALALTRSPPLLRRLLKWGDRQPVLHETRWTPDGEITRLERWRSPLLSSCRPSSSGISVLLSANAGLGDFVNSSFQSVCVCVCDCPRGLGISYSYVDKSNQSKSPTRIKRLCVDTAI